MDYDFTHFTSVLSGWKISFSDLQREQLTAYYEMLAEKNKVMNLTAITKFEDVIDKHFLDSLSVARFVNLSENLSVLDLGTGAGFPGLPLKIMFPNLSFTLVDSLNKRILFLDEVIKELGLTGIKTIHGRAEDLAREPVYREKFDLCVSRAVANLASLSEYCLPFVKPGGMFISYKSSGIEEELSRAEKAILLLGGKVKEVPSFCLEDTQIGRSLVMIEKEKKTPKAYPRKSGVPVKKPLC